MRVAVMGAGYVGLVTGVSLARAGHHVDFIERAAERRAALADGRVPIFEPGLQDAFDDARARITVVEHLDAAEAPDLLLVAVGTPIADDGAPDESQLSAALESLRGRPNLDLSVRSTLSPGTSQRLPRLLGRSDGRHISTNPEFLRQGTAMADFVQPSRIVIGRFPETSAGHLAKLANLYADVAAPRLLVDIAAAELIKNVANAFLALKLSFVNEVASLSEEYGVDVEQVLAGIGLDPRIGTAYMRPGLGFGGSCLPKELRVVSDAGRRQGLPMHIARAAALVNGEQQDRFAKRLLDEVGAAPRQIGVLGLSFKADTDDLRGSPAVAVVRRLLQAGHVVVVHDPAVSADRARAAAGDVRWVPQAEDVFDGADAVAVATDWPQFSALDLAVLRARMRRPLLYDGRNLFHPRTVTTAGLSYRGIGRVAAEPPASDQAGGDGAVGAGLSPGGGSAA